MQNRTDFGTPHFSTLHPNMDVSCLRHRNKSPQMHKIRDKHVHFLLICELFPNILSFPSILFGDKRD